MKRLFLAGSFFVLICSAAGAADLAGAADVPADVPATGSGDEAKGPSPDESHCFAPDKGKNYLVVHESYQWDSAEVDRIQEDQVFYGVPVVYEGKAENKILVHVPGDPIRQICNERCYAGIVRRTEVREVAKTYCQGTKLYIGAKHKSQKPKDSGK